MTLENLSRRDFLKLSGASLAGLFLPRLPLNSFYDNEIASDQQGRVLSDILWLYDKPTFSGKRTKLYWRDLILNITNVTVSDEEVDAYNRIWYEVGTEGYAYSGNVQPVRTSLNAPQMTIPAKGALAEVTVPFTDAFDAPSSESKFIYRMYYETVHWILSAQKSTEDGKIWYQVLDDKYKEKYFAPAEHLRILPEAELAPTSTDVPDKDKHIEVYLDRQWMLAYEGGNPVFASRISSGGIYRVGTYTTPVGKFMTYYKRPTRHMAAGDLASSGFDLPGVPWVLYITESGISFHGTFWHNDFGKPHSHGCINLTPAAAKWLYLWTTPTVRTGDEFAFKNTGTKVSILV